VHPPTGAQVGRFIYSREVTFRKIVGGKNSFILQCNLAWKLALVLKNYARPTLLTSYNDERIPVVAQMLQTTTALYSGIVTEEDKADNETGWFRWRNQALLLYGVNYRYSDIVLEERDTMSQNKEEALAHAYSGYDAQAVLQAGDRAPEAPGLISMQRRLKTSLFEQYKPTVHTVLIFTSQGEEQLVTEVVASLKKYPEDAVQTVVISSEESSGFMGTNVLIDGDGYARSAYLVQRYSVNVVVVRPDGFIGATVVDAAGVQRYFSKIFDLDT